ncbi:putative tRNA-specific adenosine deaminase [Penicillium brasilianum]|uniref:Putative tRNA-specific adenosine deaminase n=1 Tax=Penicillium brasilianum TaxID=104259 RepID=A0A1S9RE37_PENBI|nr:putative tRNA-specific adenosine deaminase [Penicillium brasilianum]
MDKMSGLTRKTPLASRIAALVHTHFDGLPARSKPKIFPDGSREWIPMTGIVAVKGENTDSERLHCISVTTGAKCLPASHIPRCQGLVLHDCHAEILAIRAFNYWLLNECHALSIEESNEAINSDDIIDAEHSHVSKSPFIRRRKQTQPRTDAGVNWPPFEIQPDVKFYMYCTCAPCGDASMELCMAAQDDATPWQVTRPADASSPHPGNLQEENLLDGRAHFSLLGVVRRKPARMDAESTRSKSCSDKLALRQVSSLLSCETSHLVTPTENAYLAGLILPEDEISRSGCERSFGENGRMKALAGRSWPINTECDGKEIGYRFRPFEVLSVPAEEVELLWPFAKPKAVQSRSVLPEQQSDSTDSTVPLKKSKPGNVSSVWTATSSLPHPCVMRLDTGSKTLPTLGGSKTGLYETIINGVKQGNRLTAPTARGASSLSRAKLWGLLRNILRSKECLRDLERAQTRIDDNEISLPIKDASTYEEFKQTGGDITDPLHIRHEAIRDAKLVLKGWVPNTGDESWSLDVLVDPKKRKG